jgi:lysophospholipase L1-like esterase
VAEGALTTSRPHVVLLMIGTNDVNGSHDLANAPTRLGLLLDRITTTSPDALVVVAQIIPFANDARNPTVQAYNAGVADAVARRSAAGEHVVLVDMYGALAANPRYRSEWMADGLHPTADGYAAMARTWYPAIKALLPAAP